MDNILKEDSDPFTKSVAVMMSIILIASIFGAAYEFWKFRKQKKETNEVYAEESNFIQFCFNFKQFLTR